MRKKAAEEEKPRRFSIALTKKGYRRALHSDPRLANGLNVFGGALTHEAVAKDLGSRSRSRSG